MKIKADDKVICAPNSAKDAPDIHRDHPDAASESAKHHARRHTLPARPDHSGPARRRDAGNSYTRQLLDAGPAKCARKLGEEAIETVIAALTQDDEALKAEAADLLYHLLVLLEARNVALDDVYNLLEARMGQSGLAEKASRSRPQDD